MIPNVSGHHFQTATGIRIRTIAVAVDTRQQLLKALVVQLKPSYMVPRRRNEKRAFAWLENNREYYSIGGKRRGGAPEVREAAPELNQVDRPTLILVKRPEDGPHVLGLGLHLLRDLAQDNHARLRFTYIFLRA